MFIIANAVQYCTFSYVHGIQDMQVGIVTLGMVRYAVVTKIFFEIDPRGGYISQGYAEGALKLIIEQPA